MEQIYYQLQIMDNIRCPKKTKSGQLKFKAFRKGDIVDAFEFNQSETPLNYVPVYKTKDGYIIQREKVVVLGVVPPKEEIPQAEVVEDKPMSKPNIELPNELVKNQVSKTKYQMRGAMIGAGVFLIYAMMKGKNKLMLASLGAVAGGFAGNMYSQSKNK